VARQAGRLLESRGWLATGSQPGALQFITSGDAAAFHRLLPVLLQESGPITAVTWQNGQIRATDPFTTPYTA
jgi:hypothetical protein